MPPATGRSSSRPFRRFKQTGRFASSAQPSEPRKTSGASANSPPIWLRRSTRRWQSLRDGGRPQSQKNHTDAERKPGSVPAIPVLCGSSLRRKPHYIRKTYINENEQFNHIFLQHPQCAQTRVLHNTSTTPKELLEKLRPLIPSASIARREGTDI